MHVRLAISEEERSCWPAAAPYSMQSSPPRPSMHSSPPQEANAVDSDHTVAVVSSSGLGAAAAPSATTVAGGKRSRSSKRTRAKKRAKKRDSKTAASKARLHSRTRRLASLDAVTAEDEACASPHEMTAAQRGK
ncbi:hypothetical protein HPB50_006431 [Hyalomma asiaticum]|uniref:Uncharacterized protein n=1 Tax=Hyalomma asiaticum TaxID=266040 RepID=A0ACB7S872_HYAAI|nr:hypothetical protein HPB50_006431 [Hyalomma asiaticum]